jgi:hypothetical protein
VVNVSDDGKVADIDGHKRMESVDVNRGDWGRGYALIFRNWQGKVVEKTRFSGFGEDFSKKSFNLTQC